MLLARLAELGDAIAGALDAELTALDVDPVELDAIFDAQNDRLAHGRTATGQLSYRRSSRSPAWSGSAPDLGAVVPRLGVRAETWPDTTLALGSGTWRDELSDDELAGGRQPVAALWRAFPSPCYHACAAEAGAVRLRARAVVTRSQGLAPSVK